MLDKDYYINGINSILSNSDKFQALGTTDNLSLIFKIEDKINRFLLKLKNSKLIDDGMYSVLHSTGSSFATLYGLPKIHKPGPVSFRPILVAYRLPNYKLAKHLVPLLSHLTTNEYSVKNSFDYVDIVSQFNPQTYLVSYDVESLFTNIPTKETIDLILNSLFPNPNSFYSGLNRKDFKTLLELSVNDTHFIFNNQLYKTKRWHGHGVTPWSRFRQYFHEPLRE